MSHQPEHPQLYVCSECQVVHAGTVVEHTDSGHRYSPPDTCGACGASEFLADEQWPHRHD